MKEFDPEITTSASHGLFGLPIPYEQAKIILINCPWEVTTSYGSGASLGPEAILNASPQIDLFSTEFGKHYEQGFFLKEAPTEIKTLNKNFKALAQQVIEDMEAHGKLNSTSLEIQNEVNKASHEVNEIVYKEATKELAKNKLVGLVGGDHSSPLGLIKALSEKYNGDFGVLHIDAHHDLRVQYQGFHYSHASIMDNVLKLEQAPKKLVQVGIRDFCESEYESAKNDPRVSVHYDQVVQEQLFCGTNWEILCDRMIQPLPNNVYISFDIDGLSPDFCPNTGTPVPGGLTYAQALYLIKKIVISKRTIIGFDLCEVAPGHSESEWDANVGARVLFQLCSWMQESQK